MVTDAHFQAANPIDDLTRSKTQNRLLPLLEQGVVPIVTGFIGATQDGVITTLGRGGSDFSAAIMGVALDADEVWIWTDVNGVMTTDPRIDPSAQTLPELTYREISELAYYGAKVLHPKTIRPVVERGIALWIKNTFNPAHPGTQIVRDNGQIHGGVKAVTVIRGQTMMTVEGRGMLGVPGVAARTFGAVARTHTSVSLITQASSEQSICFTVPEQSGGQCERRPAGGIPARTARPRHRRHCRDGERGHRDRGGRGHAAYAGHLRARVRRAGRARYQHHRHRAGFERVQHQPDGGQAGCRCGGAGDSSVDCEQ